MGDCHGATAGPGPEGVKMQPYGMGRNGSGGIIWLVYQENHLEMVSPLENADLNQRKNMSFEGPLHASWLQLWGWPRSPMDHSC